MSKADGKKIAIKFNLPINPLTLISKPIIDTNYSTPTGVVTASSYMSPHIPSRAFDNSTSLQWYTTQSGTEWIKIELTTARSIAGFNMYVSYNLPNEVSLYGSNDDLSYELIISTNNAMVDGWKTHEFQPTIEYKFYKWEVVSRHRTNLGIYELGLKFVNLKYTSGNESAFIITGQECRWIEPRQDVELIPKTYSVSLVQTHPTEPNSILLDVDGFRNVQGNITISYNQALGNLTGTGGAVGNFTETFMPSDLVEGLTDNGGAIGTHEYISVSVCGTIELINITKIPVYVKEHIIASIGGTIQLINIDDINP